MRAPFITIATMGLALSFAVVVYGQPESGQSDVEAGELARILRKLADGERLSADDIGALDNAVIRVDDTRIEAGDPEIAAPERERNVYILKVERGETNFQQFLQMQKALLRSQITILKILAVIARHQDRLERRVARTENVQREMVLGMRDIGEGVDSARLDISSTNAGTGDIAEMSQALAEELRDMGGLLMDEETR